MCFDTYLSSLKTKKAAGYALLRSGGLCIHPIQGVGNEHSTLSRNFKLVHMFYFVKR